MRSREIGIQEIHNKGIKPNNIELIRRDYYANGGWETFLEYGDPEQDILIGLLRLRKCSKQRYVRFHSEMNEISMEHHVYLYCLYYIDYISYIIYAVNLCTS